MRNYGCPVTLLFSILLRSPMRSADAKFDSKLEGARAHNCNFSKMLSENVQQSYALPLGCYVGSGALALGGKEGEGRSPLSRFCCNWSNLNAPSTESPRVGRISLSHFQPSSLWVWVNKRLALPIFCRLLSQFCSRGSIPAFAK